MKIKKIFSLVSFFVFFNFSVALASKELPSSLEELISFFLRFLKEFPGYLFQALNEVFKILQKIWNWFETHFFQKIYFSMKKEIQKKEPIVKKEFEREKLEIKKEFREWLSSLLNKIQAELKKK